MPSLASLRCGIVTVHLKCVLLPVCIQPNVFVFSLLMDGWWAIHDDVAFPTATQLIHALGNPIQMQCDAAAGLQSWGDTWTQRSRRPRVVLTLRFLLFVLFSRSLARSLALSVTPSRVQQRCATTHSSSVHGCLRAQCHPSPFSAFLCFAVFILFYFIFNIYFSLFLYSFPWWSNNPCSI